MSARERLEARFRRAADEARAKHPIALIEWPELRIPEPLLASMLMAEALTTRAGEPPPEELAAHYCGKMPQLLVEQLADERFAPHFSRAIELEAWPRLAAALDGLYGALASAGLDAAALLGAPTPAALLAARSSPAALYAGALFASGLPLTGAYPRERALLLDEMKINDPRSVMDLRLSGNLIHELAHGPPRARADVPWLIVEAAALHLGAAAHLAHVLPDVAGEAVPGVARFVLVGEVLAARFGEAALWRVLVDDGGLAASFPPRVAAALEVAAWQEWLARREAPFARDAERAFDWIKLACGAADALVGEGDGAAEAARRPSLLDAAARTDFAALAWFGEQPQPGDRARVARGVRALFRVNRVEPVFHTAPSELPDGRVLLDVAACRLRAAPRADGVFGEPADWLFPPPLARRLLERGARRVAVEGVTRARAGRAADALYELALGTAPLAAEVALPAP
jgi:hypothetical protein